jgi:DNA repair protein RadD
MSVLTLRPYQRDGIDALYEYWGQGGGNGLLVYPTGAGKSLVLAAIVQELLAQYPGMRIGVVTHVRELILQDYQELMRLWPGAPAGVYSAGLGRRDTSQRIIFAGIQSAWKKTKEIGAFDLLLIDEAHLISRSTDTTYGKFISALREMSPEMRVVGLTATPYRLDSGRLDDGGDALFEKIIYEARLGDLIDAGYLAPLISKGMSEIDVSSVSKRGGEFVAGDLERAVNDDGIVRAAVAELVAYGGDRRAWLVFCAGVKHASHVRDEIVSHGITCEAITGDMDSGQRDSIINRFRAGEIRCLTSVGVLTTGFNVPHVDLVGMMRPTLSTGLFVQQVGRGFRTAPGKDNCLVLDWAGNVRRHGPVDLIEIKPNRGGKKEGGVTVDTVRAKECPTCKSLAALNAQTCAFCGHEWTLDKARHDAEADDVAILSRDLRNQPPEEIPVVTWMGRRHVKAGSPDSLRVTYSAGLMSYPEWVLLGHKGPGRYRAEKWWVAHGGRLPVPDTIEDALVRWSELSQPAFIAVTKNGKWWNITGRRFSQSQEQAA